MSLSVSNVLFHFTGIDHARGKYKPEKDSLEVLKSILQEQAFRLSMNKRNWTVSDEGVPGRAMNLEIPMTCFTETPISFIPDHMKTFGHFGIGMRLKWGIEKGAQNVVYCDQKHQNSYGRTLAGVLGYIHHGLEVGEAQPCWYWFRELVVITEDIGYREEREWRFLGRTENIPGAKNFEPKTVSFKPSDVVVVVCPQKYLSELRAFIDNLPSFKDYSFGILCSEYLIDDLY